MGPGWHWVGPQRTHGCSLRVTADGQGTFLHHLSRGSRACAAVPRLSHVSVCGVLKVRKPMSSITPGFTFSRAFSGKLRTRRPRASSTCLPSGDNQKCPGHHHVCLEGGRRTTLVRTTALVKPTLLSFTFKCKTQPQRGHLS